MANDHSEIRTPASTTTTTSTPQPRTAPAPFDKSIADVILRTSDHVDFHVFTQVLIAASPFFEGLFEVPQPSPDQEQLKYGKPIIEVSEDSVALETLLRICYPINKPAGFSIEQIELALRAAMKYDMELPTTVLTGDLENVAKDRPMAVWAVACRLQLEDLARVAAKALSPSTLDFDSLGNMDGISAGDYYRLNRCHASIRSRAFVSNLLTPSPRPFDAHPPTAQRSSGRFSTTIPTPDIICRSSDGHEFLAHEAILSAASRLLVEKVGPAGAEPVNGVEPKILVFEVNDIVLASILRFCYNDAPEIESTTSLLHLVQIVAATERYKLNTAHVRAMSFWCDRAESSPLRAYCIAIQAGHLGCAKEAARAMLTLPLETYVPELETTPALAYHRLSEYYKTCRNVALVRLQKTLEVLHDPHSDSEQAEQPPPTPVEPESVGFVPAVFKLKRSKKNHPLLSQTWIRKQVTNSRSSAGSRPRQKYPALAELFTTATAEGPEGFWCSRCHPLAEDLIKADCDFKELMKEMDAVSRVWSVSTNADRSVWRQVELLI
ncbi:hypothetical protein C8Q80DRAFT_244381 [Daedaleopsis nitida]|nr:hypothetical protein C8Q80DRAFT_244381 [Daedaleopsis nitida]